MATHINKDTNKKKADIGSDEIGVTVNKVTFAKYIGKSTRQISRYEKAGMPSIRTGGGRAGNKINFAKAWDWSVSMAVKKRVPDQTGPTNIDAERLRLTSEQADEKAIKNAVDRGELIAAEYVNEFAMTSVANLAGALSGLPGRLANELAREADPAQCREIIKREIDRARNQFADSFGQLSKYFDDRADPGVDS